MADRIRAAVVSKMTSLAVRTVLDLAAAGKIPGAAKLHRIWTFDPVRIENWIREQEAQACQPKDEGSPEPEPRKKTRTSTYAITSGGDTSVTPAFVIEEAYVQLMGPKRRNGSKPGAKR
jgi:hypothetical protein